jgi:ATP-dependent DNA helicase RecG
MERCNDGFQLAEEDLKLRREGDVLGNRQHGISPLRLVNVIRDAPLIKTARTEAERILSFDPLLELNEHAHLASELRTLFGREGV